MEIQPPMDVGWHGGGGRASCDCEPSLRNAPQPLCSVALLGASGEWSLGGK